MVVYGEMLLLENFLIGGALIYLTAKVHRVGIRGVKRLGRALIGSTMCSIFSLFIFCSAAWYVTIAVELAFATLLILTVFGLKQLILRTATFIIITYLIGGMVMALLLATRETAIRGASAIYTGDLKGAQLAIFISLSIGASSQIIKTIRSRKLIREHVLHVKVICGEYISVEKAFLDTGSTLYDPLFNVPVAIANHSLWTRMSESGCMKIERMALVPYEAVGIKGVLQGIRCDSLECSGHVVKSCVIAQGDKNVFFGYGDEECTMLLPRGIDFI